jgi:hypothetical protein
MSEREQVVSLKVNPIEKQILEQAAKMSGQTLSGWSRDVLLTIANGKRVEVSIDKLDWLRDAIRDVVKLQIETLRTILEHVDHESPKLECQRRMDSERKTDAALTKIGIAQP